VPEPLPTPDDVLSVLRGVIDPELGSDIVELGMAKGATVSPDGEVVADECHLLRQSPTHDDIVAIQAEPHRLACEHFLIDTLFDRALQLFGCRLALRLRFPERGELRDFTRSDADLGVLGMFLAQRRDCEQQRADEYEMQQRLAHRRA